MDTCRCGAPLAPSSRRPRKYCSAACRWRAWNARHPRVDTMPEHEQTREQWGGVEGRRNKHAPADCDCNALDEALCLCQGECECHEVTL